MAAQKTITVNLADLDGLNVKAAKLDALLSMTHAEAGPTFREMEGEVQDIFLWACGDLAFEIKQHVMQLCVTDFPKA